MEMNSRIKIVSFFLFRENIYMCVYVCTRVFDCSNLFGFCSCLGEEESFSRVKIQWKNIVRDD